MRVTTTPTPRTPADFLAIEQREKERMVYKPVKNKDPETRGMLPWLTGHESKPLTWLERAELDDLIRRLNRIRVMQNAPLYRAAMTCLVARLKARRVKR